MVGPTGPSEALGADDVQYTWLGPGHFGTLVSGPYPDGRRVIWSNGRQTIAKLDYDTLETLALLPTGDQPVTRVAELEAAVRGLDELRDQEAVTHALTLAVTYLMGLDGVYALVDCDNTLLLTRRDCVVAYRDADPADPDSPIIETARWPKPIEVEGEFVGVNLTFDGRLVLSTDHGWLVCLTRDFTDFSTLQLPGARERAAEHWAHMLESGRRGGYGWVRKSLCVDEDGGIYVPSVDHLQKVVWTGQRLSTDEADGAWSAPYRNGGGWGSGTTPSLMGFGSDEDRFVVIGDGDEVVNITLFWRDDIPDDWEQLSGAPCRRIAGIGPANMGDPGLRAIQTEQSITVSGYGAMAVNNEPASMPEGLPQGGGAIFVLLSGPRPGLPTAGPAQVRVERRHADARRSVGVHRGVHTQLGPFRVAGVGPGLHVRHPRPEVDDRGGRLDHGSTRVSLCRRRLDVQHVGRWSRARPRGTAPLRDDLRQDAHPAHRRRRVT